MPEEKIYILLSKYFRDESTTEEVLELQGFLSNESLRESVLFRVLDRIEENEIRDHNQHHLDKEGILKGIKEQLNLVPKEQPFKIVDMPVIDTKSNSLRFLRIAASVCLLAVTSWLLYTNFNNLDNQKQLAVVDIWKEIETQRGQIRTVSLPDGSEIKLNVSSKLRFERKFLEGSTRKIYLDGEAFFEVAKMPDKPFVVLAKGVETSVLGTSFNIEAYAQNETLRVAVVTGKVKVRELEGQDQIYLEPDEMATWGNDRIEKSKYDSDLVLAWTNKSLIFKKASFSQVIQELENWYDVDITLEGKISSSEYDGVHVNEPLETLLKGLSFAGDFKYEIEGKKITITSN